MFQESARQTERYLLYCLLHDPQRMPDVAAAITVEDFQLDAHRRIFAAMLALYEDGQPIDAVALADQLYRTGELEDVGGYAFIGQLQDTVLATTFVDYYCQVLRQHRNRRILADLGCRLIRERERPSGSVEVALEDVKATVEAIEREACAASFR